MNGNQANIQQIRDGLKALHEAIERKGEPGRKHGLVLKVFLGPATGLTPEQVVEVVEKNKNISDKLSYTLQAAVSREPMPDLDLEQAKTALRKFEQDLATLPADIQCRFHFEFVCPNEYELGVLREMQEITKVKAELANAQAPIAQAKVE